MSLVNENSRLRGELERLEQDLQTRLHTHKQQLEGAESSINTLLQRQSTDEAAIAGLVSTVQELRGEKVQSAARVSALQKDLEESGRELTAAETKLEELVWPFVSCKNLLHFGVVGLWYFAIVALVMFLVATLVFLVETAVVCCSHGSVADVVIIHSATCCGNLRFLVGFLL